MHQLVDELVELALPMGDWALFGSGPLLMRGWIDEVGDLDIISRGQAWEKAQTLGSGLELAAGPLIYKIGEGITVGTRWAYGNFSIDELIDSSEILDGIPCVLLKYVVAFKEIADRPKDRKHLALISALTR